MYCRGCNESEVRDVGHVRVVLDDCDVHYDFATVLLMSDVGDAFDDSDVRDGLDPITSVMPC
jgi:NAD/NADP transhydrogenase beta subunit